MDIIHLVGWKQLVWFVGVVIAAGKLADHSTREEARLEAWWWLMHRQPGAWARAFTVAFDAVFGAKHLSRECILRSAAASLVALVLCFLTLEYMLPGMSNVERWTEAGSVDIALGLALCVVANIAVDYVSLLETRLAVGAIAKRKTWLGRIGIVGADVLLSSLGCVLIYLLIRACMFFAMTMQGGWGPALEGAVAGATGTAGQLFLYGNVGEWAAVLDALTSVRGPEGLWSPFLWSTYLTSVWLWFFILARLMNRWGGLLGDVYKKALNVIDVERKPFLFVAIVCSLLTTIVFLLSRVLLLRNVGSAVGT